MFQSFTKNILEPNFKSCHSDIVLPTLSIVFKYPHANELLLKHFLNDADKLGHNFREYPSMISKFRGEGDQI